MKKIALLLAFICLGLSSYASSVTSLIQQNTGEAATQNLQEEFHFNISPRMTANVSNAGPDIKIKVSITMTDGGTIGAGVTWGPDGQDCVTIELYVNDSLVGTFDDCP